MFGQKGRPCGFVQSLGRPIVWSISIFLVGKKKIVPSPRLDNFFCPTKKKEKLTTGQLVGPKRLIKTTWTSILIHKNSILLPVYKHSVWSTTWSTTLIKTNHKRMCSSGYRYWHKHYTTCVSIFLLSWLVFVVLQWITSMSFKFWIRSRTTFRLNHN